MATSYLRAIELNNFDYEIFQCWKKSGNINDIYKQITKINNFKETSKDYLLARLEILSIELKIKIKLFNNSASYSVNEDLIEIIDDIIQDIPKKQ